MASSHELARATLPTAASAASAATTKAVPPGPSNRLWGLPLLRAMRRDYLGFAQDLQRRHGDLSHMRLGAEHAYDLFHPELVREALVEQADALIRWERGIEVFEQVVGRSLLVSEGADWQRQRRMLQPAFTPRRVAGYARLMREAAGQALDRLLPPTDTQAEVDMDALWSRLAMDVILRTLFSTPLADDASRAQQAVRLLSDIGMREMFWPFSLPDWLPLPGKAAKRQALRTLRGLVDRHIAARWPAGRAAPDAGTDTDTSAGDDLLGHLLALRDEQGGAALSRQEVFDQCVLSFQAGHETSATALLWWSRLMAEHAQVQQRVQQELDAALAGRAPEAADLARLPWLTATLKEAMRLYPPIAALMTRRTTRAIRLGGWPIPAGALLRITPWVIQRDARWYAQPDQFRPERFLPEAEPPARGAWLAFGVGPRVCTGQHFAMLEMQLSAALLLQRCTLALPPGTAPARPQLQVTLRPAGGLRLLCRPRRSGGGSEGGEKGA